MINYNNSNKPDKPYLTYYANNRIEIRYYYVNGKTPSLDIKNYIATKIREWFNDGIISENVKNILIKIYYHRQNRFNTYVYSNNKCIGTSSVNNIEYAVDFIKQVLIVDDLYRKQGIKRSLNDDYYDMFSKIEEEYMKINDDLIKKLRQEAYAKLLLNSIYGLPARNSNIQIDKVIFSGDKTIIIYKDGTKSYATVQDGDDFDPEKGIMVALLNKILGKKNFHDILNKYINQYHDTVKDRFEGLVKDVLKSEITLKNDDSK